MTKTDRINNEFQTLINALVKVKDIDPALLIIREKLNAKIEKLIEENRSLASDKDDILERSSSTRKALEKAEADNAKLLEDALNAAIMGQERVDAETKEARERIEHLEERIEILKKNLRTVEGRAASQYKPQITKRDKKIIEMEEKIASLNAEIDALNALPASIERCLKYAQTPTIHPNDIKTFMIRTMETTLDRHNDAKVSA